MNDNNFSIYKITLNVALELKDSFSFCGRLHLDTSRYILIHFVHQNALDKKILEKISIDDAFQHILMHTKRVLDLK